MWRPPLLLPLAFAGLLLALAGRYANAVNPGCQCVRFRGSRDGEGGEFHSPDFPRPYENNIDCILYVFSAAPEHIVTITFEEFSLDKSLTKSSCEAGDYVKLFLHLQTTAVNEHTPWTTLLCGEADDLPHKTYYSTSYSLIFQFHSDGVQGNNTGFRGTYEYVRRDLFVTGGRRVEGSLCDYSFISGEQNATGRLFSPQYPSTYPRNALCTYTFKARPNERVRLEFDNISFNNGGANCLEAEDTITIRQIDRTALELGLNSSTKDRGQDFRSSRNMSVSTASPSTSRHSAKGIVIGILCATSPRLAEFVSSLPLVVVTLKAESAHPGRGFSASYAFEAPNISLAFSGHERRFNALSSGRAFSCDRTIDSRTNSLSGILTSPNYLSPYPPNIECRTELQGQGRQRVLLVFHTFHLHSPSNRSSPTSCEGRDSLTAYNGPGTHEQLATFCGSSLPRRLMSSGPSLTLVFRSITSGHGAKGYKIKYFFVDNLNMVGGRRLDHLPCAFEYDSNVAKGGEFTSPNSAGLYPRHTECHYFFRGQSHEQVRLVFSSFDVRGHPPCDDKDSDYLEFSSIFTRDTSQRDRKCAHDKPKQIVRSNDSFLRVTFRSNGRDEGTGFSGTYRFVPAHHDIYDIIGVGSQASHSSSLSNTLYNTIVRLLTLIIHHRYAT
ncbi:suppressor of lurcher protein 1-like [Oratosquilla oratoria]|uniref:suppressor of lurcher protein 1-like n=1 Tax=Oratosquilla oratoria TaxID=337810 RepID=UPI003F7573F1